MKKPRYKESIYTFVFLCLSIAFLIKGCLCFIGIMKSSEDLKVQNPVIKGVVFYMMGFIFCVMANWVKSNEPPTEVCH